MSKKRVRRKRERRDVQEARGIAKAIQPEIKVPIYDLLSEEGIEQLHQAALKILAEVGIDFYDEEAVAILKEHGVKMVGDTAYFDAQMVEEYIALAPEEFTQIARNPENNVQIGGNNVCFAPVYGPPFVYDIDRGRREATMEDFDNFVKLTYMSRYLHSSGGTIVEPTDEPVHTRHLDMIYSHIKHSDKPFMGSVTEGVRAADSVRLAEIAMGDRIYKDPAMISLINISSPRRLDDKMLGALKVYAKANQATIITPFIFSGAMAPVGIAGTIAQYAAESLAGIVFAQMVRPGCPVIFGAFQTNIDLQSGAPVFGSPESQLAIYAGSQLARKYKLPFRSGGMFASSKTSDAQAAYESVMTMLPAVMGRVNFVLHAAGWLEGGLAAGYEKFILDHELLGFFHTFLNGLDMSPNGMAMDAITTVPVDSHHLGTPHTMKNFRTAFHRSSIFDYNSYEQWVEEGSKDINVVANATWKKLLKEYEAPPLDASIDAELKAFITKRKGEIPPDF